MPRGTEFLVVSCFVWHSCIYALSMELVLYSVSSTHVIKPCGLYPWQIANQWANFTTQSHIFAMSGPMISYTLTQSTVIFRRINVLGFQVLHDPQPHLWFSCIYSILALLSFENIKGNLERLYSVFHYHQWTNLRINEQVVIYLPRRYKSLIDSALGDQIISIESTMRDL